MGKSSRRGSRYRSPPLRPRPIRPRKARRPDHRAGDGSRAIRAALRRRARAARGCRVQRDRPGRSLRRGGLRRQGGRADRTRTRRGRNDAASLRSFLPYGWGAIQVETPDPLVHPEDQHAAAGLAGKRQIADQVDAEPVRLAHDGQATQPYLGEEIDRDVTRDDEMYGAGADIDLERPGGTGHVRACQVDEQLSCKESLRGREGVDAPRVQRP